MPKHKASEKLQAELKTKIKHASDEAESERHKKRGGVSYKIPRQGAGQLALVGPPNGGKSRLLTRLTRATPEVAPYPFTTHQPTAGMMDWEDVRIQLIDLPPITADVMEGWVSSMIRAADAALFVVDLADDDGPFAAEAVLEKLTSTKTVLVQSPPAGSKIMVEVRRTMLVANKADADGATDRSGSVSKCSARGSRFMPIAAEPRDRVRGVTGGRLSVPERDPRVHQEAAGKPADKVGPFTCPVGSTVAGSRVWSTAISPTN